MRPKKKGENKFHISTFTFQFILLTVFNFPQLEKFHNKQ